MFENYSFELLNMSSMVQWDIAAQITGNWSSTYKTEMLNLRCECSIECIFKQPAFPLCRLEGNKSATRERQIQSAVGHKICVKALEPSSPLKALSASTRQHACVQLFEERIIRLNIAQGISVLYYTVPVLLPCCVEKNDSFYTICSGELLSPVMASIIGTFDIQSRGL